MKQPLLIYSQTVRIHVDPFFCAIRRMFLQKVHRKSIRLPVDRSDFVAGVDNKPRQDVQLIFFQYIEIFGGPCRRGAFFDFDRIYVVFLKEQKVDFLTVNISVIEQFFGRIFVIGEEILYDFADYIGFKECSAHSAVFKHIGIRPFAKVSAQAGIHEIDFRRLDDSV